MSELLICSPSSRTWRTTPERPAHSYTVDLQLLRYTFASVSKVSWLVMSKTSIDVRLTDQRKCHLPNFATVTDYDALDITRGRFIGGLSVSRSLRPQGGGRLQTPEPIPRSAR